MKADDNKGILIFAEQRYGEIHRVSFELLYQANRLADKLDVPVSCVVCGPPGIQVEELIYHGADKVYYYPDEIFNQPDELIYKDNLINLIEKI